MNINVYLYRMRKRMTDEQLIKAKKIISDEIDRRVKADNNNKVK